MSPKLTICLLVPPLLLSAARAQGDNSSLSSIFPELLDLKRFPLPHTEPDSYQNTTYCCLQAVEYALDYVDDKLTYANQSAVRISGTPDELRLAGQHGQFPCTASFNGNDSGAPQVLVSHAYCRSACGRGWVRSRISAPGDWLSAFVGFIIPAIVFCLGIPRRRKLEIPNALFGQDFSRIFGIFTTFLGFVLAGFLAATDLLVWLSTCFALSGPSLFSATYEAFLDIRVLEFLQDSWKPAGGGGPGLTCDMRARLLFSVLIGNLDLDLRKGKPPPPGSSRYLEDTSPLYHIEKRIYNLRIYDSHDGSYHPQQWPRNAKLQILQTPSDWGRRERCIAKTKTRLRSMLECQYSFGAAVGAPVVFFLGAFIYTLLDVLSVLGNQNTSLALALGMWWMIIPHMAILVGLLLAGNNPNMLESIVALPLPDESSSIPLIRFAGRPLLKLRLSFPSRYKTQWIWTRGDNKQKYIDTIIEIYRNDAVGNISADYQMESLRERTTLTVGDWIWITFVTLLLLKVPFILAFLTSYFTPTIGLACRSLTFTIYTCVQVGQIILHRLPANENPSTQRITNILWYIAAVVFGCMSVFTAIGGTMMELMGVYSQCICNVSAKYWLDLDNPAAWIEVSTNSSLDIHQAKKFWKPLAITAIGFLGLLSYFGWWWQRRLRDNFREVVRKLEVNARLS